MDKSTRRAVFVLYVILFLLSIMSVSMIQISMNGFTAYTLNIEYESHTTTATSSSFDHDYNTINVNIPIMVNNYQSILSGISIGTFPLWVNASDWVEGETVSISDHTYSISIVNRRWTAHRSFTDYGYEDLFYHKDLWIFIESYTDRIKFETGGFSGYSKHIEIQRSNIDGFVSKVTGSNVVGNIVLLSAIFTEIPIIKWLYTRREVSEPFESSK